MYCCILTDCRQIYGVRQNAKKHSSWRIIGRPKWTEYMSVGQPANKWSAEQVVSFSRTRLLDAGHVRSRTTLTDVGVTQRVALRDAVHAAHNEITDRPSAATVPPNSTHHIDRVWDVRVGSFKIPILFGFVYLISVCIST